MALNNRIVLVPREHIHPTIEGVDFGGPTWVMIRSPRAVLLWVGSHSWSLNGSQRYSAANMQLLTPRRYAGNLCYRRLHDGGRLSAAVVLNVANEVNATFDDELTGSMLAAIRNPRRTILVEGGGPRLMPSRLHGQAEYNAWRDLPEEDRGFTSR